MKCPSKQYPECFNGCPEKPVCWDYKNSMTEKLSECCQARVKKYVKSRNRGSGLICSSCQQPCTIASNPDASPDRLMTDEIPPLITHDDYDHPNYPNKTRLKHIPNWDLLDIGTTNQFRLVCQQQRDADVVFYGRIKRENELCR